jgi:hypothetical protein
VISTYQALAVAIVAILPGATYSFAYERHAGAYGAHVGDRLIRFVVASAAFHALFGDLEFVLARHLENSGLDAAHWWQVELIIVAYFAIPFLAGSALGIATKQDLRWARWFVGSSRHPRAWDHLWTQNRQLLVRIKLNSGEYLAGLFEPADDGISSYASGYGEEADVYLSRQLIVDAETGAFVVDANGLPVAYEPVTGLLVRAAEVESWHIQEVRGG